MLSPELEEPRHLVGDAAAERPSKQLVGTMGLDLAQRLDVGGGHLSDAFVGAETLVDTTGFEAERRDARGEAICERMVDARKPGGGVDAEEGWRSASAAKTHDRVVSVPLMGAGRDRARERARGRAIDDNAKGDVQPEVVGQAQSQLHGKDRVPTEAEEVIEYADDCRSM